MLIAVPPRPCPKCGSPHTQRQTSGRDAGMVIGGLLGSAIVVIRVVSKPLPVVASALLAAGLMGLLWGAQTGRIVGEKVDDTLLRRHVCRVCGEQFEV